MLRPDSGYKKELFTAVYIKYKNYLFTICYEILKNEQDAEDALQEALLKIFKNIEKIDDTDLDSNKVKSLLIIITRNTAIDFYRKRQKKRGREVCSNNSIDCRQTHMDPFQSQEESELFHALCQLPLHNREAILLKYASGYSTHDISNILGIPEPAVRMRISRGKKRLAILLSQNNRGENS